MKMIWVQVDGYWHVRNRENYPSFGTYYPAWIWDWFKYINRIK